MLKVDDLLDGDGDGDVKGAIMTFHILFWQGPVEEMKNECSIHSLISRVHVLRLGIVAWARSSKGTQFSPQRLIPAAAVGVFLCTALHVHCL